LKNFNATGFSFWVKILKGFDLDETTEYMRPTIDAKKACMMFITKGALKKSGLPVSGFDPYGFVLILSCKTDHVRNDA
jgi:hypothetical protein